MRFIYSVKKSSSINIVEMDLLRKDRVLFGKINCLLQRIKEVEGTVAVKASTSAAPLRHIEGPTINVTGLAEGRHLDWPNPHLYY